MKPRMKLVDAKKNRKKQGNFISQLEESALVSSLFTPAPSEASSTTSESPSQELNTINNLISLQNLTAVKTKQPAPLDAYRPENVLVGDILWSKITGHNWWPSMITYDPDSGVFFKTVGKIVKYHVQFFGDASLRGWVTKTNILLFSGLVEFKALPSRITCLKLSSPAVKKSWEHAVTQAQHALSLDRNKRKLSLTFDYQPSPNVYNYQSKPKSAQSKAIKATDAASNNKKAMASQQTEPATEETSKRKAQVDESEINTKKKKFTAIKAKTIDVLETTNQQKSDANNLSPKLKNLHCVLCEGYDKELVTCIGGCFNSFHLDCLGISTAQFDFKCDECISGIHCCFICKKLNTDISCTQNQCGKFYHTDCIQKIKPKTLFKDKKDKKFVCSLHSCTYCDGKNLTNSNNKLVKCIRCPTAYHQSTCLVAGSSIIASNNMICDQHFEPKKGASQHNTVNVTWCFVCSVGGDLVCCDTCPASFHVDCYEDLTCVPENAWQCNDCVNRNKPRYGDIVWVKFGVYRWWPGKICTPDVIPERIMNLPHVTGQFPVMFLGSHDYCWIHTGRVFKYQNGDKGGKSQGKISPSLLKYFNQAVEEAKQVFADVEKERAEFLQILDKKKSNKPPTYGKTKVNRPVSCIRSILDPCEWPVCDCTQDNACSADSECLNRMLLFECSPKTCPTGDKCENSRMQKGENKKSRIIKCEGRGWGLQADEDIKQGDFVIEYVGELVDEETCRRRVKEYHEKDIFDYYFLTIDKDNIIDAYPKGNLSRFMNHSCKPNCETQKWTVNGEVRVGLFATRDIVSGDELCFNYNLDSLGNDKKQCKCGSDNCSGYLGVPPKTQHAMKAAQKTKTKKEKEQAKKASTKKQISKLIHDNECFVCADGGELLMCSRNKCTKTYHVGCLKLEKLPYGKWECPWHFCDECGKAAKVMCILCTNSYCEGHAENEIVELQDEVALCVDHDHEEFEKFCTSVKRFAHSGDTKEMSTPEENKQHEKDTDEIISSQESKVQNEKGANKNAPLTTKVAVKAKSKAKKVTSKETPSKANGVKEEFASNETKKTEETKKEVKESKEVKQPATGKGRPAGKKKKGGFGAKKAIEMAKEDKKEKLITEEKQKFTMTLSPIVEEVKLTRSRSGRKLAPKLPADTENLPKLKRKSKQH